MTSPQHTYILDLSTYVKRLFRQTLWALIPAVLVLGVTLPWAWNAPISYQAKAAITAFLPEAATEAEATQQAAVLGDIAAVDLLAAQQSPEIVDAISAAFPEIEPDQVRSMTEIKVQGRFGIYITITADSAEKATDIANLYASSAAEQLTALRVNEPPSLRIEYRTTLTASEPLATPLSGKMPRMIIAVGLTGLTWLAAAAVLDARAQVKRRRS